MPILIQIGNVLINPKEIASVEPYVDEKSRNQNIKVHMRGGQHHLFGMTPQRFHQLVREKSKVL